MRLKSKVSLLCALGICVLFTSCTQGTGGSSKTASNIQAATSKPVFDILDSQQVSYEEDYSHLVKDGRFLKGKLPSSKDKKNNQQAKSSKPQYKQEGYASWYDSWFHGRKTSSGVEYDEDEYSAAHRTLPIPSVVKVINLENRKTVTVVVNDRGPFKGGKNRIIDLSRQAADDLGIINKGTAKVKIEFLADETKKLIAHLKPVEQKKAQVALNSMMN
jgi:rare lipoprotein A (peptidoglycan hydrolase)